VLSDVHPRLKDEEGHHDGDDGPEHRVRKLENPRNRRRRLMRSLDLPSVAIEIAVHVATRRRPGARPVSLKPLSASSYRPDLWRS